MGNEKLQYHVKRPARPVDWTVSVPGSKSITNRALLMAALSKGEVTLNGVLFSDDSRYFLKSLQSLGFTLSIDEEARQVRLVGCGGSIPKKEGEIYVGSAGTAARFLTAMLGISDGRYRIQASPQMQKRPMKPLFDALLSLGSKIIWLGEPDHLPVEITGAYYAEEKVTAEPTLELTEQSFEIEEKKRTESTPEMGKNPVELALDISESTQFLSAFLLISPMFSKGLRIRITSKKTDGSYIRITRRMMETFGVQSTLTDGVYEVAAGATYERAVYQIEPDVSAACYFYGAAAITGGSAKVLHVHKSGMQGDLKFLDVLEEMGCAVCEEADGIKVTAPRREVGADEPTLDGTVSGDTVSSDIVSSDTVSSDTVSSNTVLSDTVLGYIASGDAAAQLRGITVNMNDFSDQALTLAAIAPYASAPVRIDGIAHIRRQESDRIHAIVSNLTRAGITCEEREDGVTIFPGQPQPCHIETFDDHRVAMAFAVMGLCAEGIVICDPMCCKKTFEQFFDVLDALM